MIGLILTFVWGSATLASSDALLKKLVEKKILTQEEADELREELKKEDAQTVELYDKTKVGSWIREMKWYGDLRVRAEYFGFEQDPTKAPGIKLNGDTDRLRYRLRLRFGVEAELEKWATIGVRLATGEEVTGAGNSEGDPVATNQTFTDTFTKKPVRIDLAYATVHPPELDWLRVTVGKMNNPIWQPNFNSPALYDFDVTPEGIAEQFSFNLDDNKRYRLFVNAGQFAVKEFSTDSNDVYLFDNQIGIEARFGADPKKPTVRAAAAGGYFATHNLNVLAFGDSGNRGNAAGGAITNLFLDDFQVVHADAEVVWAICDRPFLGTPCVLTISGEYLKNMSDVWQNLTGATFSGSQDPGQTEAYIGQIEFGDLKKRGQWQVAYEYKYLEADATWDAITESDFGTGGTDRKGHVIRGNYMIRDWWQFGCTAFVTRKISDRNNLNHNTVGNVADDLLRVEVDTVFKF